MKKKDKKMIIGVIVEAMKQNAVKDFHNGLLTYVWDGNIKNPHSIYLTAENVFNALQIETLMHNDFNSKIPNKTT